VPRKPPPPWPPARRAPAGSARGAPLVSDAARDGDRGSLVQRWRDRVDGMAEQRTGSICVESNSKIARRKWPRRRMHGASGSGSLSVAAGPGAHWIAKYLEIFSVRACSSVWVRGLLYLHAGRLNGPPVHSSVPLSTAAHNDRTAHRPISPQTKRPTEGVGLGVVTRHRKMN
jgi:hypothetical protein